MRPPAQWKVIAIVLWSENKAMKYDEINNHPLMKKWYSYGDAKFLGNQTSRRIYEHVPLHFENINSKVRREPFIFGVNLASEAYLLPEGFLFIDEILKLELMDTDWELSITDSNSPIRVNLLKNTSEEILEKLIIHPKYAERTILLRQGQPEFKNELISLYGCCMITGCKDVEVLEGCHIVPYSTSHDNSMNNGLLLRADIHTLFDRKLIKINQDFIVKVSNSIQTKEYRDLDNKQIIPHPSLNRGLLSENLVNRN